MEKDSPKYCTDSFIPFPTENIIQTDSPHLPRRNKNNGKRTANESAANSASASISWKIRDCYSCGVVGLHEEINDFYEKMHPTEQETEIRLRVVESITKTVHSLWPHAKVEVFGSFRTGLYLPSSDIDLVVIGEWKNLPLSTLSKALEQIGISEDDITIIAHASVPIIRLVHTPSRVKVDISFNMMNGVEGAKMVKNLMKRYPTLPKLLLVLKQFLIQRGLNEVYNGGMSSYCLTLLLVSLLQGYHKPTAVHSTNLGTLLLEFFEHYGVNFNYESVSIHFEDGGNYKPKYKKTGMLNVEDPMIEGKNIAKGTYLMHQLQLSFQNAFHVLHKAVTDSAALKRPLDSYLSLIINVDDSVWNERRWMEQNYSIIINQLSSKIKSLENNDQQGSSNSSAQKINRKKKFR